MLVFNGIVALAFYGFLIGTAWPAHTREPLAATLVGYWAKSLWLSWLIVAISYWLDLPNLLWPLVIIVLAAHVWWACRQRRVKTPTHPHLLLYAMALVVPILLVTYSLIGSVPSYSVIFVVWDALFSWNRWAAELAENTFNPYSAAYPVLFPGLWSLIYKAQGDPSVWIIAKASMLIFPFIIALAVTALIERRHFIAAMLFCLIAIFFLWFMLGTALTSGYMDAPVAAMIFVTAAMIIVSIESDPRPQWAGHLTTVSLLVGLSAITKQAGLLLFLPFTAVVFSELVRSRATIRGVALQTALAILPPVTFYLMFQDSGQNPIGNLQYLQELATSHSADGDRHLGGLRTLRAMLPDWAHIALLVLAVLNLANIRRSAGVVGIVLLITAIIGGVIFADCCSYEARNGWWVVVLMAGSAGCGLTVVDTHAQRWPPSMPTTEQPSWALPAIVGGFILVSATSAWAFNSDSKMKAIQADLLWTIGNTAINEMVRNNIDHISTDTVIVSPYMHLLWLPIHGHRINACPSTGADCVHSSINSEKTVFLVGSGTLAYDFLPLEQMRDRLLGDAGGYHLYGPFEPGELSTILP